MNWLPFFAKHVTDKVIHLSVSCFIIIIQHLYTMGKCMFAPLFVLSSVYA